MTEQDGGDIFVDQVDFAHQQISRPFDLLTLRSVIDRATEIHGIVADPALRYVLADIRALPSLPSLYLQIVEELDSDDPSIRRVGEIVAGDIGMSTKVLQVANSVLFGARVRISDPIQATVQLGADLVKSLVLMTKVFDQCDETAIGEAALTELVDHSLRVGARARLNH